MDVVFIVGAKFVIAVILAALSAYMGIYLFDRTTKVIDEWAELRAGNLAVGITLAAFVVGLAIVLQNSLRAPSAPEDLPAAQYMFAVFVELLTRFVVSFVLGVVGVLAGVFFYDRLTGEMDEFALIGEGNTAVATTMAAVIIASAILIAPVADIAGQFVSQLFL